MSEPQVSVIVLNYNGKPFLDACVASLEAQTFQDFELILVDNASQDGSWDHMVAKWEDRHLLINNETNLGYAEGNNVGLRRARGRFLVVLNNDTEVAPNWLEELVNAADQYPDYGMFASQIRSYSAPEVLDTIGVILYRDGMSRGLGRLEPAARYEEPRDVFAPSGCAGFYRREMLEAVGFFEKDYFAYCEDTDLGFRGQLAGFRCRYVPTARVYHHYSATAGKYSPLKAYLVERNHLYLRVRLFPKRMLLMSPFYTLARYALQAYGVFSGKGAAGKFTESAPATDLIAILVKAYLHAFIHLPALLRQRKEIARIRRASSREISSWFDRFSISARELALKD